MSKPSRRSTGASTPSSPCAPTAHLPPSKLDKRIIPAFWVLYFLCSAIRSNIGIAQTMNKDVKHDLMSVLGLTARDTSTALTLFYVSYVLFDLPSNLIMSRLSPRVWMARIVTAVGIIGACFAAAEAAWSVKLLRFLLGVVTAGMWPGMAYYLTLFYPPSRTGKRIAMYFTASQVSAAVVGLVSAGFQKMDGVGGLVGFRWMFLIYGLLGIVLGVVLLFWLPDRPLAPGETRTRSKLTRWLPASPEALTGKDAVVHYHDLRRVYHARPWNLKDLGHVLVDWRLWPLVCMYFGVVGVGIGTQLYGSVIIAAINPSFTGVQVSLLFAPIWMVSLPPTPGEQPPSLTSFFSDGLRRDPSRRPHLRPLPQAPRPLLLRRRLHPDCRPPDRHLRAGSPLGALRRPPAHRLRPRPHGPDLHDVD
jgi:MFS family permease